MKGIQPLETRSINSLTCSSVLEKLVKQTESSSCSIIRDSSSMSCGHKYCNWYIYMILLLGLTLSCYQCDSRYDSDCKEQFDHENIDQLIIRPTECTVDAAQFCIKTIGVWGGTV